MDFKDVIRQVRALYAPAPRTAERSGTGGRSTALTSNDAFDLINPLNPLSPLGTGLWSGGSGPEPSCFSPSSDSSSSSDSSCGSSDSGSSSAGGE